MVAEYNTQWFWRRQTRRSCRRMMSSQTIGCQGSRQTPSCTADRRGGVLILERRRHRRAEHGPETGRAHLGVRMTRPGEPTSPFAFQAKARLHIRPSNQARQARVEARDGVHITTECPHIFKRIELVPECWMIN